MKTGEKLQDTDAGRKTPGFRLHIKHLKFLLARIVCFFLIRMRMGKLSLVERAHDDKLNPFMIINSPQPSPANTFTLHWEKEIIYAWWASKTNLDRFGKIPHSESSQ